MRRSLFLIICLLVTVSSFAQNPILYLLVGTYTKNQKDGIYVYRFNPNKGEATFISKTSGVSNPSYLAFSKNQKYLYAVNENHGDATPGEVSAFAFDKQKGELHFLNKQASGGDDPAYISVDSSGKNVVVANYSGGNLALLKTNADGSLQPALQVIAHEGYGVNVKRQEMPHVHSVVFSPDEQFLFSADLGNDRIYKYKFNANDATTPLTDGEPAYYELPDGSGPRHIVFSPNKKFAYVITELSGKVIAYQYNNGQLTEIQSIESDNSGNKGDKGSSAIHLTPDGKFLYTSNRVTENDITIYKTGSDGKLILVGHQPTGIHPRDFMVDPTGRFLLVANRDSNNIQVFVINKNFGLLEDTHTTISVDMPVCLKMVPVKEVK